MAASPSLAKVLQGSLGLGAGVVGLAGALVVVVVVVALGLAAEVVVLALAVVVEEEEGAAWVETTHRATAKERMDVTFMMIIVELVPENELLDYIMFRSCRETGRWCCFLCETLKVGGWEALTRVGRGRLERRGGEGRDQAGECSGKKKGRRDGRGVEGKGKEGRKGAVQRKRRKKNRKKEGRSGPFCMNQ